MIEFKFRKLIFVNLIKTLKTNAKHCPTTSLSTLISMIVSGQVIANQPSQAPTNLYSMWLAATTTNYFNLKTISSLIIQYLRVSEIVLWATTTQTLNSSVYSVVVNVSTVINKVFVRSVRSHFNLRVVSVNAKQVCTPAPLKTNV